MIRTPLVRRTFLHMDDSFQGMNGKGGGEADVDVSAWFGPKLGTCASSLNLIVRLGGVPVKRHGPRQGGGQGEVRLVQGWDVRCTKGRPLSY